MIYTIGSKEVYDKLFQEKKAPKKMGRNTETGYFGGWVWATREEAQTQSEFEHVGYLCYKVYGVDADWEKDTVPADLPGFPGTHYLLVDSLLVQLDETLPE